MIVLWKLAAINPCVLSRPLAPSLSIMTITPVILSGGTGTRLWPLSRRSEPKQFAALTGEHSLLQQTVLRTSGMDGIGAPIIVGNRSHTDIVRTQLAEIDVAAERIIVEPAGRNTAPAIALAALAIDRSELMLVMPSDAMIADVAAFRDAVGAGVAPAGNQRLVTFGVKPTRPEIGYGYIETGEAHGSWLEVVRFVEKPDIETAQAYFAGGGHLWNAGMFLFSAGAYLDELARHAPDVLEVVSESWDARVRHSVSLEPGPAFSKSRSISIDHAVMEPSERIAVVPLDAGWSDIGSWEALWEIAAADDTANVTFGDTVLFDVSGSYVRSDGKLIAVVGLDDVVIVDTPTALLVTSKRRSQDVKRLLDQIPEGLL